MENDLKLTDENDFLSRSMMIKAKNNIMKERTLDQACRSTKIICYLKEDQSEFLEERQQKDLVNEFTDFDRGVSLCPGTLGIRATNVLNGLKHVRTHEYVDQSLVMLWDWHCPIRLRFYRPRAPRVAKHCKASAPKRGWPISVVVKGASGCTRRSRGAGTACMQSLSVGLHVHLGCSICTTTIREASFHPLNQNEKKCTAGPASQRSVTPSEQIVHVYSSQRCARHARRPWETMEASKVDRASPLKPLKLFYGRIDQAADRISQFHELAGRQMQFFPQVGRCLHT